MTLEQVKQLSDEQIRIKVAELLGWRPYSANKNKDPKELWLRDTYSNVLPKYSTDLNACHEMEETLNDSQKDNFEYVLGIVIGSGRERWRWHLLHATARQRCEAFIAAKERET